MVASAIATPGAAIHKTRRRHRLIHVVRLTACLRGEGQHQPMFSSGTEAVACPWGPRSNAAGPSHASPGVTGESFALRVWRVPLGDPRFGRSGKDSRTAGLR